MKIKEMLLKGKVFADLLKDFAIEIPTIEIQNEDMILNEAESAPNGMLKEMICITAKNGQYLFDFFGTLYFNVVERLAVFELQGFEKLSLNKS
ncbi:hypothetical protein [Pedobacter montanisoli]|uniref:Uncharacterized protein n=1 Tax=Pedobacter montanisoli TaxID=2923277 RepID=A0ABS9ZR68_9SPHI|nr:hypothetical protein [Pedobacter montanisoli]MCJ0741086.1 hypothetical protein [Pedobacter montanisoli]